MFKKLLVAIVLLSLSTVLLAQKLPEGDGRNTDFMKRFAQIKRDNGITDAEAIRMPVGAKYTLPNGEPEMLVEGDTHGIWGHEFAKFYGVPYEQFLIDGNIPVKEESIVSPPVKAEVATSDFPWMTLAIFILGLALLLAVLRLLQVSMRERRILRQDPQDATLQGPPMRSRVAATLGLPTTRREHIHTATALLADMNADRQRRGQALIQGNLAEIVEVGVRSTSPVMVEYADRSRGARPGGQRVALGVFRNQSGVIETVTFHFSACDNGMLFNRMPPNQVEEFVRTATWTDPRRIYVSPAYRTTSLNWQDILGWINANLVGTAQLATPIRNVQQAAPVPAAPTSEALTPATSVSVSIVGQQVSVPVGTAIRIVSESQMEVSVPGPCTLTIGAPVVAAVPATPAAEAPKAATAG